DVCITGKLHRKKFCKNSKSAENVLEVIHSDVCGKITPQSLGGKQYFVTFLDDNSRFSTVEVLTNKCDVLPAFQRYVEKVEVLQERRIKFLQSDNGGEYCSAAFNEYLDQKGIGRRLSVARTPQQNGRSERLNRTLLCIVRCILENAGLPKSFWGEAVLTASNIRNCCPSKAIQGRIPIEVWSKKAFTIDMAREMKVFGCRAWDLNLNVKDKLDSRAVECIYLGSARDAKGYRLYSVNEKKIRISRDARFEESVFPYKTIIRKTVIQTKSETPIYVYDSDCTDTEDNVGGSHPSVDENDDKPSIVGNDINVDNLENVPQENVQPRRTTRTIKQKVVCECCAKVDCGEITLAEPKSVGEALSRIDRDHWIGAMKLEIENLKKNQTWEVVRKPKNVNVIGSRWVFSLRKKDDGTFKYKARLVAQGFHQVYGIDFWDSYSPVMRRASFRILMALSVDRGWEVDHVDVVGAYLNSTLKEIVYMRQPELFEEGNADDVCLLLKSIYGLHQSGKDWNDTITFIFVSFGLKQCTKDPCVFFNDRIIVAIYVDDMIICGTRKDVNDCKRQLSQRLNVKDLGPVSNFLGINVDRPNGYVIKIHQENYVNETLKTFGMLDCKGCVTPRDPNYNNFLDGDKPFDEIQYKAAVGRLQYIATCTRPDIVFSTNQVSKFCHCPTKGRWLEVMRIMRYLKHTIKYRLTYEKSEIDPVIYSDSDFANDVHDSKSVAGYVIMMSKGAVSWKSKKQDIVATSTNEAEYIALYECSKEVIWMREFLSEINVAVSTPSIIFGDNLQANDMCTKNKITERNKHFRMRQHKIREYVNDGDISIQYVDSSTNCADMLTKATNGPKINELSLKIGLKFGVEL
ncbi:hypothetical protein B7P43_G11180, partial [Cryptotermes secundus]